MSVCVHHSDVVISAKSLRADRKCSVVLTTHAKTVLSIIDMIHGADGAMLSMVDVFIHSFIILG